ncbi:hypothetical protein chiPu_0000490 [Chiloscyllium punctatum]|uniref:Uncharacterized protein n=1 Tax=Chiloscyllium punctatum TaxID=137246 RepID=A0A401RVC3_CHIPU|nr:hypothetical protein [Chiloscyllium punctatum]
MRTGQVRPQGGQGLYRAGSALCFLPCKAHSQSPDSTPSPPNTTAATLKVGSRALQSMLSARKQLNEEAVNPQSPAKLNHIISQ